MFRLPRSLDLLVAPILVPEHGMARPFTPRTSRLVACPEMWHHYVFDRAINTTGLSPAGSQNCRLLHLGGTLTSKADLGEDEPARLRRPPRRGTPAPDWPGPRTASSSRPAYPTRRTRRLASSSPAPRPQGQEAHRSPGPRL